MSEPFIVAYVARHGTTALNAEDCYRGNVDVPLDKKGFQDAAILAKYFEPIEFSLIVSSEKIRATATADKIAEGRKVLKHANNDLRAWDMGNLSGQKRTPENQARVECHVQNPEVCMPGGESLNDFKHRVQPLIQGAIEIGMNQMCPVLIVAHSSIVHEVGEMVNGAHASSLVLPGGCTAIYLQDGEFHARPIFKPDVARMVSNRADIVT